MSTLIFGTGAVVLVMHHAGEAQVTLACGEGLGQHNPSRTCCPDQQLRVGTRGVLPLHRSGSASPLRLPAPGPLPALPALPALRPAPPRTCAARPWRLWTSEVGPGRGRLSGLAPRGSGALPAGLGSAPPAAQSPPRGGRRRGGRCGAVPVLGSWSGRAEKLPKKQLSWIRGRLGACAQDRLGKTNFLLVDSAFSGGIRRSCAEMAT